MSFKFKCNVCGSTECYKIDTFSDEKRRYGEVAGKYTNKRGIFNYSYSATGRSGTGIRMEISSNIDSYVCKRCGHIEFYANQLLNKIEKDEAYYSDKVDILLAQLEIAKRNVELFTKEYNDVSNEYYRFRQVYETNKNYDRTSYEMKISNYKDRLNHISVEIGYEKQKILDTEKLLEEYKYFLKNVNEIVFR